MTSRSFGFYLILIPNLNKPEKNDPQISQIDVDRNIQSGLICEICGQFLVHGTKISLISY